MSDSGEDAAEEAGEDVVEEVSERAAAKSKPQPLSGSVSSAGIQFDAKSFSKIVAARRKLEKSDGAMVRRQEMDARSEYVLRCLSVCLNVDWYELIDIIYQQKMLARIEMLFMANGPQRLIWFCQRVFSTKTTALTRFGGDGPLHSASPGGSDSTVQLYRPSSRTGATELSSELLLSRSAAAELPETRTELLLTDGLSVALTDQAAFMLRIVKSRGLTNENIQKEVMFGNLLGGTCGLLVSMERRLKLVFIPILSQHFRDLDSTASGRSAMEELLLSLSATRSALHVAERSIEEGVVLEVLPSNLQFASPADAVPVYRNSHAMSILEKYVNTWIRQVEKVLMQSELLRCEGNETEPHRELEFWKIRRATIESIVDQFSLPSVEAAVYCLQMGQRGIVKLWRRTRCRVMEALLETRDNIRFLACVERHLYPLMYRSPPELVDNVAGLFNAVKMIRTVSNYYNTSERLSTLLIKVTNQMIVSCKNYISDMGKQTVWSQPEELVRKKFLDCIRLRDAYRTGLMKIAEKPTSTLSDRSLNISHVYILGKFDAFCDRLRKLMELFDSISTYSHLFNSRVEGLLQGLQIVEECHSMYTQLMEDITSKDYNYINHENKQFSSDLEDFRRGITALLTQIHNILEKKFDDVWETPQGFLFIERFRKVASVVPGMAMEDKFGRMVSYFLQLLADTKQHYMRHKDNPPLSWSEPPVAGRIRWAKMLCSRITEPMKIIESHRELGKRPEVRKAVKQYNSIAYCFIKYQHIIHTGWMKYDVFYVEKFLATSLIRVERDSGQIRLWFSEESNTLIRELEMMQRMQFDIPPAAHILMSQREKIFRDRCFVQEVLDDFAAVCKSIPCQLRKLLTPHVTHVKRDLESRLTQLNWASRDLFSQVTLVKELVSSLGVLIGRLQDILTNRMEAPLRKMSSFRFYRLPEADPWKLHHFLEMNHKQSLKAATDLESLSVTVEEGLLELVKLVKTHSPAAAGWDGDGDGSDSESDTGTNSLMQFSRRSSLSGVTDSTDPRRLGFATDQSSVQHEEIREQIETSSREIHRIYHTKVLDMMLKATKTSLEVLRKHVTVPDNQTHTEHHPLFSLVASLHADRIQVSPQLAAVQETLTSVAEVILSVSQAVPLWRRKKHTMEPTEVSGAMVGDMKPLIFPSGLDSSTIQAKKFEIPSKRRNFGKHVKENKEITKQMNFLMNCIKPTQSNLMSLIESWKEFEHLWLEDAEELVKAATRKKPSLDEYEQYMGACRDEIDRIARHPSNYKIGPVVISTGGLKSSLQVLAERQLTEYSKACRLQFRRTAERLMERFAVLEQKLAQPISDLEDVRTIMSVLSRLRGIEHETDASLATIEDSLALLAKFGGRVSSDDLDYTDTLQRRWQQLQARASQVQCQLGEVEPHFRGELLANIEQFEADLKQFCHDYQHRGPMEPGLEPRLASDRMFIFQNRFDGLWRRHQINTSAEELIGLIHKEYPVLNQVKKELNLLQKLYKLYNEVIDRVNGYSQIPWTDVNIEEINNELMEFQNRCRKLPKGLKEWPAFNALKKTIDDFNDMCPLIELMSNKAMKSRHWTKLSQITSYEFKVDQDEFCLNDVLIAPLLQHKEDIEDVCISAMKERDIEAKLRHVTTQWFAEELCFTTFKNRGELLLRGDYTADIITALDDSLMILASLMSNRYNAPFRRQIQKWLSDLSNTNEILERWLFVQNLWVYLEAVFVGGDIAKQLPQEAKRFYIIDRMWQRLMHRAHETTNVVTCCVGDDTLKQQLPNLQEQLELCQKSLSGYLEKKRVLFPRFFFVSDPALLEVLGQASDSHTIQSHLMSIFDNTKSVKFHDVDYDKIMAIVSSEGESINLEKPVRAEGSVEVWLMNLLRMAQQSLHAIIRQSYYILQDPSINILNFINSFPAQVGILGIQMIWTRDAETALSQCKYEKRIMGDTNNRFLELLNMLIDRTAADLTPVERAKYETLVTVHVHQRDIFDHMCRMQIKAINDFEWMKQCRFYFKDDSDKTSVGITDVHFVYQNEFLGCTDRLVITPLTDRCYITLAQAIQFCMGGCPNGPAGTGKTETVKDMGKTLGKYVVVFNCSDQMEYRGLGRIFKGLTQSGSWGCFDEFNRIELPVLSVAAQQVAVILSAKKEHKKDFVFTDGETVELNTEFGIFLTMNPSYAGRHELPENLKIQFRNVAMMIPDRQIIIRVKLASCGFLENITLARKFFSLYKLCEEQLTNQVHYDFGLRNILSVLRTLGAAKRGNSRDSESTIVMRVLRDMNLSKLIDEDEPLFLSLINDLFPNIALDKAGYPELETAIGQHVQKRGLTMHPPWALKVIQLYETQLVRHGIMILGPSGSGKSACIGVLLEALSKQANIYRELRMNPKSISVSQMFGRLDLATNDWTDGIFSALWRKSMKPKKGENIWLVLDGPVDPVWIENLNSVLDDNKTLTLANGDRLPMAPTCKIIFEPQDIDNASPATVSRNGMVYMSSSGLDWRPIFRSWANGKPDPDAEWLKWLKQHFDSNFSIMFGWAQQNLKFKMQVLEINIITQMLVLLDASLPEDLEDSDFFQQMMARSSTAQNSTGDGHTSGPDDEDETNAVKKQLEDNQNPIKSFKTYIERIYVFCLMWSIGAFLETEDRARLEKQMRHSQTELDLPLQKRKESIFDYFIDDSGQWQHWRTRVTDYVYPANVTPDYLAIMVPNVDNIRTNYLISLAAKMGKPCLLLGEPGSAKTSMVNAFMKNRGDEHINRRINFTSATQPFQFQRTLESFLDKHMGSTYGPPSGKKMTVFVDDLSMPHVNNWGDQETNELMRQAFEMKGFYSLEKPGDFVHTINVHYLAAMSHPGGGRNDIPSRLKRHFVILNCALPSNSSIDRIFGTIAMGHFCGKRGFPESVRELVKKLVPLNRKMWHITRTRLLPTPAKFHYVFSLRELSRIWQGMVGTLSTVIESEQIMMSLWQHEFYRVVADRFIQMEDRSWLAAEMKQLVNKYMGPNYASMMDHEEYFVDFLRDAPEPTGDETEDVDMEMPKVYERIGSFDELRERLDMFLAQFNDMTRAGAMDLVFFVDAITHLIKISRIIRSPGGNALLVGVGGSGKQSLTKLACFIAGYKLFNLTITRSYNANNLLEDLKVLYRNCGVQGKETTFIFTEQDVKEEVFLEYINNVLASGVISNLFNRDEIQEICNELTPLMKREQPRTAPNTENLQDYFFNRVKQHLHVVLCFSPVGEKFRSRALRFPGLVSGCTVDWFQAWPKTALIAVARHYVESFPMEATPETRDSLIQVMGTVQDTVADCCIQFFQRFRRSAHVTPKSYLSFINTFKTLYQEKNEDISGMASRMDSGLTKLDEASVTVRELRKQLTLTETELAAASEKAEKVLFDVTRSAKETEGVRDHMVHVKEAATRLVEQIAVDKQRAEEKLKLARPALEEAEAALNTIKPAHIATVRKLGRPPHLVMRIMDCVLILFQKHLQPVRADPMAPCPKPSWVEALKMMSGTSFLQQLQNYPKDSINDEMVELLAAYFSMEDYNMEVARRVCGDVAGLLSWTRAMAVFHGVNKEVLPLKANLAAQEARLDAAEAELMRVEADLAEKEDEFAAVNDLYNNAVQEKTSLTEAAEACRRKMHAATELIQGLGGEKLRWTQQSKEFKEQLGRLVGDALLAVGFLSYAGPFNQEFRNYLQDGWKNTLTSHQVPFSADLNIVSLLCDNTVVAEWNLQGLPGDDLSIENGIIVTQASSYPLLIDPQGQGKAWIKVKDANSQLQVSSINHAFLRTHLENSLSFGRPLLLEDVGEELDPVLDNLLEKKFIRSGSTLKVLLGDKECDFMPGFFLYITTSLPNPAYSPEIASKTAIIDFTVTKQGLEEQLLGRVIRSERQELERNRVSLISEVMENKRKTKTLEDDLLYRLTSSQVSLVDDEDLMEVLHVTKITTKEVQEKLKNADEMEKHITKAREEFRPVAARGSILYFLITEMNEVNVMYQTSLVQFLGLFDQSLKNSESSDTNQKRIVNIIDFLTYHVWRYASRGLYKRHKTLFTLLLAIKTGLQAGTISHCELLTFIKGGASLDLKTVPTKPCRWILDITWLNLVELSKLEPFQSILGQVVEREREWRAWFEKPSPEEATIPNGYTNTLDAFRKLLLIRSWCPDRTVDQARTYVAETLGERFCEELVLDLESTWMESDCTTPLVCFLSVGADPSPQLTNLAKLKHKVLRSISMGQSQEERARLIIQQAMAGGDWVLLQNCHLSLHFCDEAIDLISEWAELHQDFRLWITTEYHTSFPTNLLQMSIKFTNEPPRGVRAIMQRTLGVLSGDLLEHSAAPQWPPLLYGLVFLHTVLQERRKFGPLGWNVAYEFNQADLNASIQFLQNHLDELDPKKGVSWPTICYMLGEVQYGGRVSDDFDKRLLLTFTQVWFSERLVRPNFSFYQEYRVPACKTMPQFLDYVSTLPTIDTPQLFGLHPNANISYQINMAKEILDTMLSIQPKESGSGGGETREAVVYRLSQDMLEKLPPDYVQFQVRERLQHLGHLLPMNIFLRQEIDRLQQVISLVRRTLKDVRLGVEGTIIMSAALRASLDAMYDARVPANWHKVSWDSSTLGFWFTELLERNTQIRQWLFAGRPKAFWMTGFFNPQGFLTAMRQEITRAHRGWALDSVVMQNTITGFSLDEIDTPPPEGVYVYGLFLEGASLDKKSGKLVESKPKVLYEPMPVVYMYAISSTGGKDPRLYESPIYRKPLRTDRNYIGSIDFDSDVSPNHWVLRGVALLCDIK